MNTHTQPDIHTQYPISKEQIAQFRRDGFIKLKNVLSPEAIRHYQPEISRKVKELNQDDRPVDEKDTYGKAFLQVSNIWRHSAIVEEFVRSKTLAGIATALLEVSGVRMYHDQALYKEASGGYTPWHVDQYYWPLATDRTVTAWIPLQATPLEMGPLSFSPGSQAIMEGRDLAISDESEKKIEETLKLSDFSTEESPYDLGEVSFHLGYTFHRAGPNKTQTAREVMTIIYMDKEMKLKKPENKGQQHDWDTWCPGAKIDEVVDTELNPVLYP